MVIGVYDTSADCAAEYTDAEIDAAAIRDALAETMEVPTILGDFSSHPSGIQTVRNGCFKTDPLAKKITSGVSL